MTNLDTALALIQSALEAPDRGTANAILARAYSIYPVCKRTKLEIQAAISPACPRTAAMLSNHLDAIYSQPRNMNKVNAALDAWKRRKADAK